MTYPTVRDASLESTWFDSPAFNKYRGEAWMKEPCRNCPERVTDFGGCRCQAFLLTGDAANADPTCSLSPDHDIVLKAVQQAEDTTAVAPVFRNAKNSRAFSR